MSREIKFRAWKIDEKRMVSLDQKEQEDWCSSDLLQDDNWKVMQYTGKTDKKGKEVWEGDIVNAECFGKHGICEVVWSKHQAAFKLLHNKKNYYWGMPICDDDESVEVIGNIYQNPELIS